MKLQDVILKAMAKKLTWIAGGRDRRDERAQHAAQAAEPTTTTATTGCSTSGAARAATNGCRWRRPSRCWLCTGTSTSISTCGIFTRSCRKEGIQLSYSWVKQALQGAGLVARPQARAASPRGPRRPLPGMLLHIDGSKHRWFQDDRYYDLIVILDDATSEIYYAQLVEEESTRTVMAALREVIERKGLFCALYSDRGSHFLAHARGRASRG